MRSIDYVTFMVVVGSFFVVSGGIHLRVRAPSSPARNTLFLFVGAGLANLVGTIAASMLLIRPLDHDEQKSCRTDARRVFHFLWSVTLAARFCRWARHYSWDFLKACRSGGRRNIAGANG